MSNSLLLLFNLYESENRKEKLRLWNIVFPSVKHDLSKASQWHEIWKQSIFQSKCIPASNIFYFPCFKGVALWLYVNKYWKKCQKSIKRTIYWYVTMTRNLKTVNISVKMHPSFEYFLFSLIKRRCIVIESK